MKEKGIIVLYKSKTGFTERYADWIGEDLGCESISLQTVKKEELAGFGTIIFGGGIYAGTINGLNRFRTLLPGLNGAQIVVFGTGATPADSPAVSEAMERQFTDPEWRTVRTFYFQSGLSYEKMGFRDKILMTMFRAMLKKAKGDSEACRMVQSSFDCTDRRYILPLTDYVREIS